MINWARVSELCDDFGVDGAADVFAVFQDEVAEGLRRLEGATSPGALQAEFHFLKGAALNLGFEDIASLCAHGEAQARDGKDSARQKARILADLPEVCAVFGREWRQRVGGKGEKPDS